MMLVICSHLSSVLSDLRLHLSILRFLLLVLERDQRGTVLHLSSPRSLAILQWITSHVPDSSELPSVAQLSLVFKSTPGIVGLSHKEVQLVQAMQSEVRSEAIAVK